MDHRCATRCPAAPGTGSRRSSSPLPTSLWYRSTARAASGAPTSSMLLRSNGIETVVVGGCTTEGCVESTARDAMFNDYYVVIAEDCVGSDDPAQHEASMLLMRHRFDIATGERIEQVWEDHDSGATAESSMKKARRPHRSRDRRGVRHRQRHRDSVRARRRRHRRRGQGRRVRCRRSPGRHQRTRPRSALRAHRRRRRGKRQRHGRHVARSFRSRRHSRQQRRHLHRIAAREHVRRRLGPCGRHEPAWNVPVYTGADRPDARAGRRAHHQHRVSAGPDRRGVGLALLPQARPA